MKEAKKNDTSIASVLEKRCYKKDSGGDDDKHKEIDNKNSVKQ